MPRNSFILIALTITIAMSLYQTREVSVLRNEVTMLHRDVENYQGAFHAANKNLMQLEAQLQKLQALESKNDAH